jgi:hypothetical protein
MMIRHSKKILPIGIIKYKKIRVYVIFGIATVKKFIRI